MRGIQVNTCRTATCENFGIEPLSVLARGVAKSGERSSDSYKIVGGRQGKELLCKKCGRRHVVKSNIAVDPLLERETPGAEELRALAHEDHHLILLRQKLSDLPREILRQQQGHLDRRLARATIIRRRKVAIELGM